MSNFTRILLAGVLLAAPFALHAQYEAIEKLIAGGKFIEAKPLIDQRLQQTPEDPYLVYNLALVHYAGGNYEDAIVLWEKVRLAPDKDLVTKAMAQIGNASYRISEQIKADGRQEDATIQLRRAQHSLQAAVDRDDGYDIAVQNYEFVSDKLVAHLVQQGNSKIEKSDSEWVKGERDLVLFRSALTDYEEALLIRPEDEDIQQLVNDTRQKMTDYLKDSGEKNLASAEKKIESVDDPTAKERLEQQDARELQHAEDQIGEAVANFEDALSISPDDQAAAKALEDAREKASKLMDEIADKWRQNSELYEQKAADLQQQRKDVQQQLENEQDKQKRKQLEKESKELAQNIRRSQYDSQRQAERAMEDYQKALDYDPENQQAQQALQKMQQKMSEELEARADDNLAVAADAQENIDSRQDRLEQMQEELAQQPDAKRQKRLENEIAKYEEYNVRSAQHAADRLLTAKSELEKALDFDPGNESAEQKLAETTEKIAAALEQAGDQQMLAAATHEEKGNEDQAIAHMEQAIKNFDSAMALAQDDAQADAIGQKMDAAREELLAQRNERAQQLAAAQQQMQAQQQSQQPQQPSEPNAQNAQEVAMEYQEMVQFAEDAQGSEEFGNFDTKAMKRVVKDW